MTATTASGVTARATDPAPPAAELRRVWKAYGRVVALSDVDVLVERGEVVALLGPNGAGKTTALRILLGLRKPDRGSAFLFGGDPRRPAERSRVGCTPQESGLPQTLRVAETLRFAAAHFRAPAAVPDLLERFGLTPLARRQTGGLSGGERRRLAVALAFAGSPPLVVLDEPSTGLDVQSRRLLWSGIRAYVADGGTVLLTTHDLDEAEALATRVVVIARGTVRANGGVDAIRAQAGLSRIRLHGRVPGVPGVHRREDDHASTFLYTHEPGPVIRRLVLGGAGLDGIEVSRASLEEAFLDLTRESEPS